MKNVFLGKWQNIIGLNFFLLFYGFILFYGLKNAGFQNTFLDALVSVLVLTPLLIGMSFLLYFYRPKKDSFLYILGLSLFLTGLYVGIVKSLHLHLDFMVESKKTLSETMIFRWFGTFIIFNLFGFICFLFYVNKEKAQLHAHLLTSEKLARDTEISKLQYQFQPHFLFNSLNSIYALIGSQPEKAREMIVLLSDFMRFVSNKDYNATSTLKNEISAIEMYLEIEKVRFSNRLKTQIELMPGTLNAQIPILILQPLVENAIKFGLYETLDQVEIKINSYLLDNHLVVEISNPFDISLQNQKKGTGFGISSVKKRLELSYFRHDLVKISEIENVFKIKITIPQV